MLPVYAGGGSPRQRLQNSLDAFGLTDVVTVPRATSRGFRKQMAADMQIRLVFLDGDHSEEAVQQEIDGFLPYLPPGGIICFDDAFTSYDGVDRAITSALVPSSLDSSGLRVMRKMFMARKHGFHGSE